MRFKAGIRILLFILIAVVLTIPVGILSDQLSPFWEKSFTNLLIMMVMLLAIYLSARFLDKREFSEYGITFLPIRLFFDGVFMGILLMGIIFGIQYALGWLKLEEVYFNRLPETLFGWVFIGQIIRYISGSVFEEAFSRGYLLKNIAEGMDGILSREGAVLFSYVFTSSIFGILHLANDHSSLLSTLNLILIGLMFGIVVIKTGKLHFAIGLHASWNIMQNNIFGAPNSGKDPVGSFLYLNNTGPEIWTGGSFGPEGGLICTFVVALATISLWMWKRKASQQILG